MYVAPMTHDAATPDDPELQAFLDTACPIIGARGWAFYFAPETVAAGAQHGLDGGQFYFLGRGGVLGDAEAPVVTAAFGYFNPDVVTAMWNSARAKLAPRAAGTLFMECCAAFGRAKLSGVEGLESFVASGEKVLAAAQADGLSLFAATNAEPRVDDLPGRAMQIVTVLREFRGSAHLVAVRAVGLSAKTAHFITRPADGKMFGYADTLEISDDDRGRMARTKAITDEIVAPAWGVLDHGEREAFLATLSVIEAAIAA
jgi:hypothetical protein